MISSHVDSITKYFQDQSNEAGKFMKFPNFHGQY